MEKHRTHFFIAIPILREGKAWLSNYVKSVQDVLPFKKWVHEEDYHITLAFLGYVESEQLRVLSNKIREAVSQIDCFSLSPTTVGVFGQSERPRIFWAGVEVSLELNELQKKISRTCTDLGIELDQRPYRPHITLARKWTGEDEFSVSRARAILETLNKPSQMNVDQVVLYQSHIGKSPMYEPKEIYNLKV